jgi:hypothetical protein
MMHLEASEKEKIDSGSLVPSVSSVSNFSISLHMQFYLSSKRK